MNLDELRQAMASDAAKENEQLKNEIKLLKKDLRIVKRDYKTFKKRITHDCQSLANRCWNLTCGSRCCFCNLSAFECSHDTMTYEQKLEVAKKMMKEEEQ